MPAVLVTVVTLSGLFGAAAGVIVGWPWYAVGLTYLGAAFAGGIATLGVLLLCPDRSAQGDDRRR